jgi:DNA-binding CsgD family transcriptional regulator
MDSTNDKKPGSLEPENENLREKAERPGQPSEEAPTAKIRMELHLVKLPSGDELAPEWELTATIGQGGSPNDASKAFSLRYKDERVAIVFLEGATLGSLSRLGELGEAFSRLKPIEKDYLLFLVAFPEAKPADIARNLGLSPNATANVKKGVYRRFKAHTPYELAFKLFSATPLFSPSSLLTSSQNEVLMLYGLGFSRFEIQSELNETVEGLEALEAEIRAVFQTNQDIGTVFRFLKSTGRLKSQAAFELDLGQRPAR